MEKRSPLLEVGFDFDPLADKSDAVLLGRVIDNFWRNKGWHKIKVWVVNDGPDEAPIYSVRSNMVAGLPPGPRYER